MTNQNLNQSPKNNQYHLKCDECKLSGQCEINQNDIQSLLNTLQVVESDLIKLQQKEITGNIFERIFFAKEIEKRRDEKNERVVDTKNKITEIKRELGNIFIKQKERKDYENIKNGTILRDVPSSRLKTTVLNRLTKLKYGGECMSIKAISEIVDDFIQKVNESISMLIKQIDTKIGCNGCTLKDGNTCYKGVSKEKIFVFTEEYKSVKENLKNAAVRRQMLDILLAMKRRKNHLYQEYIYNKQCHLYNNNFEHCDNGFGVDVPMAEPELYSSKEKWFKHYGIHESKYIDVSWYSISLECRNIGELKDAYRHLNQVIGLIEKDFKKNIKYLEECKVEWSEVSQYLKEKKVNKEGECFELINSRALYRSFVYNIFEGGVDYLKLIKTDNSENTEYRVYPSGLGDMV